jgi:hypothetical protein
MGLTVNCIVIGLCILGEALMYILPELVRDDTFEQRGVQG